MEAGSRHIQHFAQPADGPNVAKLGDEGNGTVPNPTTPATVPSSTESVATFSPFHPADMRASAASSASPMGYDVGGTDGLAGFKTRRSIGRWQEEQGGAATCFPSAELLRDLRQ